MLRAIRVLRTLVVLGIVLASLVPSAVQAERVKVLILGDSVASVLRWSPTSMKSLWKGSYDVTLEVWGCQKLVDPGCIEGDAPQASALRLLQKHRDEEFDVVVVATGYNDTGATYLQQSIRRIYAEVSSQGGHLMWLTYRENGNVKIKARQFNKVVKSQSKKLGFSVLDWEAIARRQKHWFTGDGVHMNAHGGVRLGNHIRRALDEYLTPVATTMPENS